VGGRREGGRGGTGEVQEFPEDEELVSPVEEDDPSSSSSSSSRHRHRHDIHPFSVLLPLLLLLLLLLFLQEQQGGGELGDKGVVLCDALRGG